MSGCQSGIEIIAIRPHAAFEKIASKGYQLEYRLAIEYPGRLELHVYALRDGQKVGYAHVACQLGEKEAVPQEIETAKEHQRRGVGNAMYVFAETILGLPLYRFWENGQHSKDAEAFWNQPNRPFGSG